MLGISNLKPTPMGYMPRVCVLGVKKGPGHGVHAYVLKREFLEDLSSYLRHCCTKDLKCSHLFERKYERPMESDSGGRG